MRLLNTDAFLQKLGDVTFLRQENLQSDLRDFLSQGGVRPEELNYLDSMERVNVTDRQRGNTNDYRSYYSDRIVDDVLKRDELLFRLFPEYLPS